MLEDHHLNRPYMKPFFAKRFVTVLEMLDSYSVLYSKYMMWLINSVLLFQHTNQTITVLWPIWAAACSDVIPSLALILGSAPQSLTRYWTTSR